MTPAPTPSADPLTAVPEEIPMSDVVSIEPRTGATVEVVAPPRLVVTVVDAAPIPVEPTG